MVGRSFSHDDAAGLLLVASEQPVAAVSRSFTTGDEGSFGELFPALAASELVPPGGVALLPMLAHDARFRTNLGFANPGSEPLALRVELRDASGVLLGTREHLLPPLGWVQDNGLLADLASLPVVDASAVVTADDAAPFVAYASVVDKLSGDPTLVLPAVVTSTSVVVPAVAHTAGVGGTQWRSDVEVLNPGTSAVEYRLELLTGEVVASAPFTLAAGEARRHADVVASVFARSGSAALRVVALSGEVAVVSRTFTAGDNGSFGQGVPAVAADAPAGSQLLTLPSLAESDAFRTNLGLVNAGDASLTAQVTLYRGDGSVVASFDREVPATSLVSLNGVFARAGVDDLASGYAVVSCDPPGTGLLAWASVVDNQSGDPSFVLAR